MTAVFGRGFTEVFNSLTFEQRSWLE
jgi:hypothetical protein